MFKGPNLFSLLKCSDLFCPINPKTRGDARWVAAFSLGYGLGLAFRLECVLRLYVYSEKRMVGFVRLYAAVRQ